MLLCFVKGVLYACEHFRVDQECTSEVTLPAVHTNTEFSFIWQSSPKACKLFSDSNTLQLFLSSWPTKHDES